MLNQIQTTQNKKIPAFFCKQCKNEMLVTKEKTKQGVKLTISCGTCLYDYSLTFDVVVDKFFCQFCGSRKVDVMLLLEPKNPLDLSQKSKLFIGVCRSCKNKINVQVV